MLHATIIYMADTKMGTVGTILYTSHFSYDKSMTSCLCYKWVIIYNKDVAN